MSTNVKSEEGTKNLGLNFYTVVCVKDHKKEGPYFTAEFNHQ